MGQETQSLYQVPIEMHQTNQLVIDIPCRAVREPPLQSESGTTSEKLRTFKYSKIIRKSGLEIKQRESFGHFFQPGKKIIAAGSRSGD
jgi:hypothetical protein